LVDVGKWRVHLNCAGEDAEPDGRGGSGVDGRPSEEGPFLLFP
jgi:hypothetical protein